MALHPGDEAGLPLEQLPAVWGSLPQTTGEAKDWYRDLVEHSHDLLCAHDLEGRILSVNPVPARLLGYSVREMLEMRLSDFIDPCFREECAAYLAETKRTGESHGLMAVVARSGEKRIWEYHSTLRTEGLTMPIVRAIAHDVTERVRAEKALRQTNEKLLTTTQEQERTLQGLTLFRTLLDQSNDAIQVLDSESLRFLDVNEKACIDLGYSREELLSMTVFDIDKDIDESWRAWVDQRIRESGFALMERVHWRKNGTSFPVEVNCRRVQLDRKYCVAVTRDITERKRAEVILQATNELLAKALREQAPILEGLALFRTLLDQSNDAIQVVEPETLRLLDVNARTCVELGYSREELLKMTIYDIAPEFGEADRAEVLRQIAATESATIERAHRRKDGTTFPVEVTIRKVQLDREYGVAIARNITARKQAEERLREFEKVVENLEEMIVVVNRDRRYLLANRAALRYRGMSKEQLIGRHVTEVVQPELYAMTVKGKLDESFAGHIVSYEGQSEYPGLGVRDIACTYLPIEGPTGIDRVACVLRDVTERKRAEEALRTSEREQHKIAEQLETERARLIEAQAVGKVGSWETELPSLDMTWSEQTHRIFETDPSNFHPRRPIFLEFVHPEDRAKVEAAFEDSLEKGAPSTVEYRIVMADGRVKVLEEHWRVFQDGQGRPARLVGTCQDITERMRTEEALRVSEAREREKAKELETILDTLPVQVVIAHDPQFRHVTANRAGRALLHLAPDANLTLRPAPGEKLQMRYLRDGIEIPTSELPMERAIATGQLVQGVATDVVLADGTTTYQLGNAAPLLDDKGNVRGAVGASIDLSELRLAEQALRESELHFRTVFQRSPLGIALVDSRSGQFLQCNPKFCEIAGREEKEVLQLDIPSITHPDDVAQGNEYRRQLVEEKLASYEMDKRYIRPDGSLRWVRLLVVPMWGEGETQRRQMALVEDITERRRAEEAISTLAQVRAESSGSFFNSMAVQLAKCLEADYTIIGELIAGDEGKVRTIGVCGQGAIADNFTRDLAATPCETVVAQGTCSYASGVTGIFPKDILLQQMKVEGYAGTSLRDSQGRVIGLMVALYCRPLRNAKFAEMILQVFSTRTAAEIERKGTEEALRQSEERFRVALKNSPVTVFNQDRDLRYTWLYNPIIERPVTEFLGKTTAEFFGAEEGKRIADFRKRVLETGVGDRHEVVISDARGKHYFDTTVEPVFDSAGTVIGITGASTDVTELREATEALRDAKKKLTEEKLYLEQEIDTELGFGEIIGQSKALRDVMEQVGKVASSNATVLLLGETGTGKELVARAIYRLSPRSRSSFIKMNCAAIPHGLLESELFGHERGAFTGAVSRKIGRLELADKGTLFLDEIGEISLSLQPKLLRVLQDQEFERLGGTQTLKVDFRLIAATNSNLADRVRDNEFRSDLYYRLNVFPIRVPPLRERREDIRLLVEHFVQKFARRMNRSITSIPKKIMDTLISWDWPGNVRELENYIERSVILTQGSVLVSPLSEVEPQRAKAQEERVDDTLEATEREHILRALRDAHGKIGGSKGAAVRLGLKRTTLQSKMKNLGISSRPKHP